MNARWFYKARRLGFRVGLWVALGALAGGLRLAGSPPEVSAPARLSALDRAPLVFEPNGGQTDPAVRYLAHTPGSTLFFTAEGVVLTLANAACGGPGAASAGASPGVAREAAAGAPAVVQLQWVGAAPVAPVAGEPLSGQVNYLRGSDPVGWQTGLPTYGALSYEGLYPGITLQYSGVGARLKGTYRVAAGADAGRIRWRYECGTGHAACGVSLDAGGALQIRVGAATLTEAAPVAWQQDGGRRTAVAARYALGADGSVGFALGAYDRALPLVIDPTLSYSSFLGGSSADWAYGVTVDAAGNMYLVGDTNSVDFPIVNAYQPQNGGNDDAFVTKLNPSGTALIYSTYLGGSGLYREVARAIAVDAAGNAYITGITGSPDFPTANAYQPQLRGSFNAFLTKLNAAGSALVYSTYLGGTNWDIALGVVVDGGGSAYVAGYTNSADFPTLNPIQAQYGGYTDGFLTKFTPAGNALVYSTYLGGNQPDQALGIALDGSGNAYLAGTTQSTNYPLANAYQSQLRGGVDAFVSKVNAAGSALVYSTFLGGNSQDEAGGYPPNNQSGNVIAVDAAGEAFVAGSTNSADFPLVNAFQGQRGSNFEYDAFLTKFNAAGSALVYSTFLGGSGPDNGHAVAVDPGGYAYLAGFTQSSDFPVVNPLYGSQGGPDAFLTKFNPDGATVSYSTYLGGSQSDFALAVAVDAGNNVYLVGQVQSTNFPLAGTPVQPAYHGQIDSFIAKVFDPLRSPTPTVTGTLPTNTPTRTPTNTLTRTPTWTPTITLTPTVTRTPTRTRTPTVTGTPPTVTPTPTNAPGCGPTWAPVAYPGGPSGAVYDVYAAGAADAWASSGAGMLRWNGSQWNPDALPPGVGPLGRLGGSGPSDVWGLASASAARWDGSAWHAVPFPSPNPDYTYSYAAIDSWAPNDAWVVGHAEWRYLDWNPGVVIHLVNGVAQPVRLTPPEASGPQGASVHWWYLLDVAAVGPAEVWAVGYQHHYNSATPDGPFVVHYCPDLPCTSGTPISPHPSAQFHAVAASNPDDVWVVGDYNAGSIIEHWDGTLWSLVPHPNVGRLGDIVLLAPDNIWAAGRGGILHFDGNIWSLVPGPSGVFPASLAASGPSDIWLTTYSGAGAPYGLYHYPDLPLFSDVLGDSPFYRYVQALACRGLISGYTCGGPGEPCDPGNRPYYRPGASVTRGQTAKIVANAAGFSDAIPTTQQTFSDVPPSNPFWLWVERIASRGIISGYTCGGPGEPCDPALRPYFRPGNNVTRGQLAKIVSSAANFQDPVPTTQQTFADIPNTNPFWLWIERVASRRIISGYTCGGPGEPCDPAQRPYFRPGNPSTRAQTAKIVVNTFFP